MKTLFLILSLIFSSPLMAHEYYFAFAEIEYNEISKTFESTLVVSTHDLEKVLLKKELIEETIEKSQSSDEQTGNIEKYLLSHFKVNSSNIDVEFSMVGFEVNLDGTTNIYLHSKPVEFNQSIKVTFDLFMNEFEDQQNKVTFYFRDKNITVPLLTDQRTQIINIESN